MPSSGSLTRREALVTATQAVTTVVFSGLASAADRQSWRTIPVVPGKLKTDWRRREKEGEGFRAIEESVQWDASETAIIICDMWADHPCKLAAMRVSRIAPRMNEVISLAGPWRRDYSCSQQRYEALRRNTVPRAHEERASVKAARTHSKLVSL